MPSAEAELGPHGNLEHRDLPAHRPSDTELTLAGGCDRSARQTLAPGGALTLHLGSPVAQPQRVAELAQRLNSVFRIVRVYIMYIPLYGSLWSMAVCSDKLDPKAFTADEIDRRIDARKLQELKYYNGETHEGVFALPNYVRDLVTPARLKQPARGRRLGVVSAAAK